MINTISHFHNKHQTQSLINTLILSYKKIKNFNKIQKITLNLTFSIQHHQNKLPQLIKNQNL